MVKQSTAVSISVTSGGFTVTWSGSGPTASYAFYIYNSTTSGGTYSLLTSDSISGGSSVNSGSHLVSYSPTGNYYYIAVVNSGGGSASSGTSQSLCTPVNFDAGGGGPVCSTTNLTMSCLSTIFSTYGGGDRGYSLQSYSSITFSDSTNGPDVPPISMSAFLGKGAYTGTDTGTDTGT